VRSIIIVLLMSTAAIGCGSKQPLPPTPVKNPPTVSCPGNITLFSHEGQPQPTANFDTPPADAGEPPVTVTCTPGSGNEFPNGTTPVTCEATDAIGRKATCAFSVIVTLVPRIEKTRFLAFGDSLTEGKTTLRAPDLVIVPPSGFNTSVSYVEQLDAKLTSRYRDQTITLVSDGLGARRTTEDRSRLRSALSEWLPESLLLLEGTNDMLGNPTPIGITDAVDALRGMVRDAKAARVRVFLATLPPMNPAAPRTKAAVDSAEGVIKLNAGIRSIAQQENMTLVDMFGAVPLTAVGPDGVHLTPEGYDLMADQWLNAIVTTLEQRSSARAVSPLLPSVDLDRRIHFR
jgi:lysophospholipase L1-like esterase